MELKVVVSHLCGCWELHMGPLQEQYILTTETSLQTPGRLLDYIDLILCFQPNCQCLDLGSHHILGEHPAACSSFSVFSVLANENHFCSQSDTSVSDADWTTASLSGLQVLLRD